MTMRAFIAVRIDPAVGLKQVLARLQAMGRPVLAVRAADLHVTLRFLGPIDPSQVDAIAAAISTAVQGQRPLPIHLVGAGAFPNQQRPAVVWAGIDVAEPLRRIVARLAGPLEQAGFGPEGRPWQAHVTLARIKARPPTALVQLLADHAQSDFGRQIVGQVTLIESRLKPDGPQYSDVVSVGLVSDP